MIDLPSFVADYVETANARDAHGLAACFVPDGTVQDEGRQHRGREAIAAWAADTAARYATVIEPRSSAGADGACTLRAEVRGNFPGSPLVLAFHFALHADGIQSLEITP